MDECKPLPRVLGGVNLAKNSVTGRGRMFQSTCAALERGVFERVRKTLGCPPVVQRQANGKVSSKWDLATAT